MRKWNPLALFSGAAGGFAVLCCVTPALPFLLGAIGATTLLGYLNQDFVLLTFAAMMFIVMGLAIRHRRKNGY